MLLALCTVFATLLSECYSGCPHTDSNLLRWSSPGTWYGGYPGPNINAAIYGQLLVDAPDIEIGNLTILAGGRLVFDPRLKINFKAKNIIVEGDLEIGSEDCPYENDLTITLLGTRQSHEGEENPKVILVDEGAKLEIHGKKKLSWTKIDGTIGPFQAEGDNVFLDHENFDRNNPSIPFEFWQDRDNVNGLGVYVISPNSGSPRIRVFAVFDMIQDAAALANVIYSLRFGDILMIALQKNFRFRNNKPEPYLVFNAIERLVYGRVTESIQLRRVTKRSTYAFIHRAGFSSSSMVESVGSLGDTSTASMIIDNLAYIATSKPSGKGKDQTDEFKITSLDGLYPKVNVVDDVTTWLPGDTVVFASTDFDWNQAEERTVVQCSDCAGNQFRINEPLKYTHWGELLYGAVDMRAEVGLLSRNVVIQGEVLDKCPTFNDNCKKREVRNLDTFGGQIKILRGFKSVHIEGVELKNMGQQTDDGRYPIHFHMTLDSSSNPYVRQSSIHNSFARCLTLHGSHDIQIIDNFCYNHMGHGYFLEDGAEINNTFDGNLAMSTRFGTGLREPLDKTQPSSFWITNPNTKFTNNVAAGGEGTGVWFICPDEPLSPSNQFDTMNRFEARNTPVMDFYNIVGHSNAWVGVILGSRLGSKREVVPANNWQPRANPKDSFSEPLKFTLEKITGYKNRRNNIWVEAGMVTVTKVSSADSLNGVTVTNDGLVDQFTGQLTDSVIVGNSDNIGVPSAIKERSLPFESKKEEPQSGLTLWKGPTKVNNVWFGGSFASRHYDIGAVAMKRFSPYFFSMQTNLSNMLFSFDDEKGGHRRAVSGLEGLDDGWKSRDGALMAGFTLDNSDFDTTMYAVRPDHLSAAAADCQVRENWRLALCSTKYGNLKVLSGKPVTFVRHDMPSAELFFTASGNGGPQVVLDGSRIYTAHFESGIPTKVVFTGEGMEKGDTLIFGVCLPLFATFVLKSKVPETVKEFVEVASLEALIATSEEDGRKYYYNKNTGLLFFKLIDTRNKPVDEMHPCLDGKCPELVIDKIKGDKSKADCRRRFYGSALDEPLPSQKRMTGVIPKNAESLPPQGWGAGPTRPFTDRQAIDGGFGVWSDWSECSATCGDGLRTRTRSCNNPIPQNGGKFCEGKGAETETCTEEGCPVDGGFSEWTEWGKCVPHTEDACQGSSTRTRTCSNPQPQNDGIACEGSIAEVRPCKFCVT